MNIMSLQNAKTYWAKAQTYPPDKERVYPEHAAVQEFDYWTGVRVLEYGCGGGSDAVSYAKRGNLVCFADIVPGNVAATSRRVQGIGVILGDSAALPFPDGQFDVVNAHGVLHHIPDPAPVVQAFFRVLKPGGALYAMLYSELYYAEYLQTHGTNFGEFTDGPGTPYARAYTEAEGWDLFTGAGFIPESAVLYNHNCFRRFKARR